jgi:hypothetical protein
MSKQQATETAAGALNAPGPISDTPQPEITPLELPDSNARLYLSRFAVGAVYIICGPTGFPCLIGSGFDLADELAAARKSWPKELDPPILAAVWWVFDKRTAQQIASLAVASDLRQARKEGPRLAVTLAEASAAIVAAAGRLHFRLTDHAVVMQRIRTTGIALEDKLTAAQKAGQLREFNKEYQRRRMAAQLAGEPFIYYSAARARLRAVLAAAADGRFSGDIIRRVFEGE